MNENPTILRTSIKTIKIREVSEKVGVSTHTLRFWEKEFEGIIAPLRTKGNQRRYTDDHVIIIEQIKRLKTEGLSLSAIRRKLKESIYQVRTNNLGLQNLDLLVEEIKEMVRSTIYNFFEE